LTLTEHVEYFLANLDNSLEIVVNFRIQINIDIRMQKQINAVKEFHTAFRIGHSESPIADLGESKKELRYNLMKEENEEYFEAVKNNDLVEIADALGDMMYILCGTIIEHGLQHKIEEVFDEIQRSNMSKLGEDGNPIYREDGKVMKGPNYFKPDFSKILL
jgi:predicted HAD superfamily Cof-like phosphohydrolase